MPHAQALFEHLQGRQADVFAEAWADKTGHHAPPPSRQSRLFGTLAASRPRAPPCARMPPLQWNLECQRSLREPMPDVQRRAACFV